MLEYRIEEEGPVYTELWLLDDRLHREDGPACIMRRTADGAVGFELWYREGRLHRDDGPAALHYDFESGRVTQAHYFQDGAPARTDDGPESLEFDPQNGRLRNAAWIRENEAQSLTLTRWLWLTRARAGDSPLD
jgi:hypothetical protein